MAGGARRPGIRGVPLNADGLMVDVRIQVTRGDWAVENLREQVIHGPAIRIVVAGDVHQPHDHGAPGHIAERGRRRETVIEADVRAAYIQGMGKVVITAVAWG